MDEISTEPKYAGYNKIYPEPMKDDVYAPVTPDDAHKTLDKVSSDENSENSN